MTKRQQVVVIGGGTGTATVLSALVPEVNLDLTAIVTVSDSGGSTGRLRDEFGFIPVGDIRQCLAALATDENAALVQNLLLYRFGPDSSFSGHNLGNLILTALTDQYHTPGKAIEVASKILRLSGKVYPISEQPTDLVIDFEGGQQIIGEDYLNLGGNQGQKIKQISLRPQVGIYPPAEQALLKADLIIFGPGDLYASLLPHTLITGFVAALQKTPAPFVYLANLMTNFAQTHRMTASQHLQEVSRYTQRKPDVVVINNHPLTDPKLIESYQKQGAEPLLDDLGPSTKQLQIIRSPLIAPVLAKPTPNDSATRNYLRHHGEHLRQIIISLLHVN